MLFVENVEHRVTITVAGQEYDVVLSDLLVTPDGGARGAYYHDKACVYLRRQLVDSAREEVFCHELMHVFEDAAGIDLDERAIQNMGRALYSFLKEQDVYEVFAMIREDEDA